MVRKARWFGRGSLAAGLAAALVGTASNAAEAGDPTGACCFADDTCQLTSEAACAESGGLYQGDGAPCNPCPSLIGACCLVEGCFEGTAFDCMAEGGVFILAAPCQEGLCEGVDGACCLEDGSCATTDAFECAAAGGVFQGVDVDCAVVSCTGLGACCLGYTCLPELIPIRCEHVGGVFLGDGSACDDLSCLRPPPAFTEPPRRFAAVGEPIIEAIGDFNLDGAPDVIVVIPRTEPEHGFVQVFLNLGNDDSGRWLGLIALDPVLVGLRPTGIAVGLLDDDEYPDAAASNAGDDTVTVLYNAATGDGSFQEPVVLTLAEFAEPSAIGAGDFTENGRIDLVVANLGTSTIVLLENLPAPPFAGGSQFVVRQLSDVGDDPVAVCPEDLDGDKDLDLLVAEAGAGKMGVIIHGDLGPFGGGGGRGGNGGGPPIFEPVVELPVGGLPVDLAVYDITGTGFSDFCTSNMQSGNLSLIRNLGPGMYDLTIPPIPAGMEPRSVDAGDLDGDGDVDLVVAANDPAIGPAVEFIENRLADTGMLSFKRAGGLDVGAVPNFVITVDVNLDGLRDIVTVNADGEFASGGSVTALLGLTCPGDLDGSGGVGFPDLVALLSMWGPCEDCREDLNRDGVVDGFDLQILLALWGECR